MAQVPSYLRLIGAGRGRSSEGRRDALQSPLFTHVVQDGLSQMRRSGPTPPAKAESASYQGPQRTRVHAAA